MLETQVKNEQVNPEKQSLSLLQGCPGPLGQQEMKGWLGEIGLQQSGLQHCAVSAFVQPSMGVSTVKQMGG